MNNAGYGVATWNGLPVYGSYSCDSDRANGKGRRYKNSDTFATCKECVTGSDGSTTWYAVRDEGSGRSKGRKNATIDPMNCNDDWNLRNRMVNSDACDWNPDTDYQ